MSQHLRGHTQTTKRLHSFEPALIQEFETLALARAVERKLKKMKRKDYIDKIVGEGYIRVFS